MPLTIVIYCYFSTSCHYLLLFIVISVQAVFFGALAMTTLRMKYLWTPYMCVLASFGISDYKMWKSVLGHLKTQGMMVSTCVLGHGKYMCTGTW